MTRKETFAISWNKCCQLLTCFCLDSCSPGFHTLNLILGFPSSPLANTLDLSLTVIASFPTYLTLPFLFKCLEKFSAAFQP